MGWRDRATIITPEMLIEEKTLTETEEKPAGSWRDRATVVFDSTKKSPIESGLRGAAQGLSLGFADEIAGGVKSLFTDKSYTEARDESRQAFADAQKENPKASGLGNVAGAVASSFVPGMALARGAKLASVVGKTALQGGAAGVGYSEQDSASGLALDAAQGGALGGALGGAGVGVSKALPAVGKFLSAGAGKTADGLETAAEKLAVAASGATGKESLKFQKTAGRELLDSGAVSFGSAPKHVAAKLEVKLDEASKIISSSLKTLDEKGVVILPENLIARLENEISILNQVPGNLKITREIQRAVNELKARDGVPLMISQAEESKRIYQTATNYASEESAKKGTGRIAKVYQTMVEETALEADPSLGAQFIAQKKSYQMFKPVQEAAEKRAATTSQSPAGGLLDMSMALVASQNENTSWAVPAILARRYVSPRVSSSLSKSADTLSKRLSRAPDSFGAFNQTLQNAAERGPHSLAVTNYILSQNNQDYRELLKKQEEEGED